MAMKQKHFFAKGGTPPDDELLDEFWQQAQLALGDRNLPDSFQIRRIGGDEGSTQAILESVRTGNKTGTVTLPWVIENSGQPEPKAGDAIILVDFDGSPALLIRITGIREVLFGDVSAKETAQDGPGIRALDIWKPMHKAYFDKLLEPYGLAITDSTPLWFEKIELLYP